MKCDKCDGTGEMQICEMGFIGKDECDKCHGKGYLTNDEWRRTCSAEEFAEWLFHYSFDKCNLCGHCWDENICPLCERRSDKDFFEKWLKEKHHAE